MPTAEQLAGLFPREDAIPADCRILAPIHQRAILINGEMQIWKGETRPVLSPVCVADDAFVTGDYTESLQALAALRAPVDAFFDDVMVNVEDPTIRANRLGLLAKLHLAMNQVADISKLST